MEVRPAESADLRIGVGDSRPCSSGSLVKSGQDDMTGAEKPPVRSRQRSYQVAVKHHFAH